MEVSLRRSQLLMDSDIDSGLAGHWRTYPLGREYCECSFFRIGHQFAIVVNVSSLTESSPPLAQSKRKILRRSDSQVESSARSEVAAALRKRGIEPTESKIRDAGNFVLRHIKED